MRLPRQSREVSRENNFRTYTGRNDLVLSKAAFDQEQVYFFLQTRQPITPHTDAHWLLLLIATDQSPPAKPKA